MIGRPMLELHQRVRSIILSDSLEQLPDTPANIKGTLAIQSHQTMVEFTSAASFTLLGNARASGRSDTSRFTLWCDSHPSGRRQTRCPRSSRGKLSRPRVLPELPHTPQPPRRTLVGIAHHCTDRLIGGKKSARQNATDLARNTCNRIKMFGFHNNRI